MNKANQIHKLLNSDEWFSMLLSMQAIDVNFKRSVVQILRTNINKMKISNQPLISVDLCLINQIVEEQQALQKTSAKYLSDLSSLS